MRTLAPIALSLFASTLVLAACQARPASTATSVPAPTVAAPTATARIIVVTATQPPYPGPAYTATALAPTIAAPQPTVTQPAVTLLPPTATVPPTPDPNERVGAILYQDLLDGSSRWNWGFQDEAAAFGLEDGHLRATASQGGAYWRFTLGPDTLKNGDQQVTVVAHTMSCYPDDAFGLAFRAAPVANTDGQFDLYVFEINCAGQARFESISGSHAAPIVGWTNTTAVRPNTSADGVDNTLQVWMAGGDFRFYANGQYLFSAHDNRLTAGTYGFYLRAGAQPGLTVDFDNLVARAVSS